MKKKIVILCAEDNPDDVFLIQRGVREMGLDFDFRYLSDGSAIQKWLTGEGTYANRDVYPLPNAIITDLMMPVVDGLELIRWIRARSEFDKIMVVIHTGSDSPDDNIAENILGANFYITKDARSVDLTNHLRDWFTDRAH